MRVRERAKRTALTKRAAAHDNTVFGSELEMSNRGDFLICQFSTDTNQDSIVQLQTYPLSTYYLLGSEENNNNNIINGQCLPVYSIQ